MADVQVQGYASMKSNMMGANMLGKSNIKEIKQCVQKQIIISN